MTRTRSTQEPAGAASPRAVPASGPVLPAPIGGAGDGQAATPAASRCAPGTANIPVRRARGTSSPPGGERPHASSPGGSKAKPSPIAAAMSEDRGPDSLDAHVRRLIKDLGLRGYHTRDSRGSHEGFPDWTIAGTRVIFRELKRESGKLTGAQAEWLATLAEAGADADVWCPSHLLSGQIARELAAISRMGRLKPPGPPQGAA